MNPISSSWRLTLPVILLISSLVSGCALFASQPQGPEFPISQVFAGTYEDVWRSIQKALGGYPLATVNLDQGLIETELMRSDQALVPPHMAKVKTPSYKYALRLTALRGSAGGKPSVKVTIEKTAKITKDFFSGEKIVTSDGWEEKLLLYRIGRELQMERYMRRAFEKGANL